MLQIFRANRASAGFSLAEVLVALVIAALMAAVLTRYAAGSRMSAGRVSEKLEMTRLSDSLYARVDGGAPLQPGVKGGRAGDLSWSMTVAPIPFSAAILTRGGSGAEPAGDEKEGGTISNLFEQDRGDEATAARQPAKERRDWTLYRVEIAVESASGERIASSAIRSRPAQAR